MPSLFPLSESSPAELHFAEKPLADLDRLFRPYGTAHSGVHAGPDTLFLLFSQTKVLTTAAVWSLVEDGTLSFSDRVTDHLPEFAAHGKGEITLFEVATHQAGYPSADVTRE